AMVNALEALSVRGYSPDHPHRRGAKRALEKLLVEDYSSAYCRPCVSTVWDTALAGLAMQEEGSAGARAAALRGLEWLEPRQLLDDPGDWRTRRPHLPGGGWAFQRANSYYPDLDDTAAVAWSMHRSTDPGRFSFALSRALDWLVGMQSENGGFASFDVDNTSYYLNEIPFADHGALLDPPISDVTARVVTALARVGRPEDRGALTRAIDYLRRGQRAEHPVPECLGGARADRRARGGIGRRAARHRVPPAHAAAGRALERPELHRSGLPARVLPPLSRVLRLLSALGARGVSQQ